MNDLMVVTDWEVVAADDFYLSDDWTDDWTDERKEEARELQKQGNLYIAYVVPCKAYALYGQMDADQVFINEDGDKILECESAVIENKHREKWELEQ